MKRVVWGSFSVLAVTSAGLGVSAYRFEPTIQQNVFVHGVPVGGLSISEAEKKIRIWWESVRINSIELKHPEIWKPILSMTPGSLGILVDDVATVADLPKTEFVGEVKSIVSREPIPIRDIEPKFKAIPVDFSALNLAIKTSVGDPHPARVRFVGGQVISEPEVSGFRLNKEQLFEAVVDAVLKEHAVNLPLESAPKSISDDEIGSIKEVVAAFTTHFPVSNVPRCANIKLAHSKIDGKILKPGEIFSYNGTVGPRTLSAGFKLAGVYKNGRHDTGVGGGICQVSTTLYNAALFADLKIRQRLNHSLPVPYVPLGRDATVDYGRIDLLIENTYSTPIAITSEMDRGTLTFRILGTKDPALSVQMIATERQSWPRKLKTVPDPKVPAGKTVLVEKGCDAFAVRTYRRVFKNGQLVRTDDLGRSHYPGGPKIVSVGAAIPPIGGIPPVTTRLGSR